MTVDDLRAFAASVADEFNCGEIRHPVHLSDGNENLLINVFRDDVGPNDWCVGNWRFQSQCLLRGVPPEELRAAIRRGESIALNFPAYRILCSAIVGGNLPIALGIAMGIKRAGGQERVHCWLGDMTSHCGMFLECREYAAGHRLPIRWYVEDNGKSVVTPTEETWGGGPWWHRDEERDDILRYDVKSRYPHAGAGKHVQF